jgi:hypothetical protein
LGRFLVFILVYLSIYGGVHGYAYSKLRKGFTLNSLSSWMLAMFMLIMIAAPVVTRMAERYNHEDIARITAYIGYIWMGFLFIFVTVCFGFDVYRALFRLLRAMLPWDLTALIPASGFCCMISIGLAVIIMGYGFFEACNIRLEHIVIESHKLPEDIQKIKIVQISDVHLGIIVGRYRLNRILQRVREAMPDILVSTGDLVDGQMDSMDALSAMIKDIPAPYGKFAVTGNHEFYAGLEKSLKFTESAGFKILRGEGVALSMGISIVGVDDPARPYRSLGNDFEKALLLKFPRDQFTIYLKHQPVIDKETVGLFDLQLSGHTHKGQIFPFSLATRLFYKMHAGLTELPQNSWLYVSRGSGTWGPPVRFLSPPEVTLIELVRSE